MHDKNNSPKKNPSPSLSMEEKDLKGGVKSPLLLTSDGTAEREGERERERERRLVTVVNNNNNNKNGTRSNHK